MCECAIKTDGFGIIVNSCFSYQFIIPYHVILGKVLKVAEKTNRQVNSSSKLKPEIWNSFRKKKRKIISRSRYAQIPSKNKEMKNVTVSKF